MVVLTQIAELRGLMSNEFHDPAGNFEEREPKAFLARLTPDQLTLLDNSDSNQLVAFITAGDGYVERTMGIDFGAIPHTPRAMASFALFYKASNNHIELAFYSRFLMISYTSPKEKAHIELRKIFDELQASQFDRANPDLEDLRQYRQTEEDFRIGKLQEAYKWLVGQKALSGRRALDVNGFLNSRGKAHSYYLSRSNDFNHDFTIAHYNENFQAVTEDFYFPYTLLQEKLANGLYETPAWFKGNTIHGIYNTKGCWSIFRNYHWDWPNDYHNVDIQGVGVDGRENHTTRFMKGDAGRPLAEIYTDTYLRYRYSRKKCPESGEVTLPLWVQMLWKFYDHAEIPLASRDQIDQLSLDKLYVDFLNGTDKSLNHTYTRFLNLFTGAQFDFRHEHIGLPRGGVADGEFNAFQKTFRPQIGPNIFNQTFADGRGWTQLYLFRAEHSDTQGFTPDYNREDDGHQFMNISKD